MILYSQRLGRLVLEDKPFSSGGAGEVFRAHDSTGALYCVKKLLKPKPGEFDKIRYMADNPPKVLTAGWGQLCWPLDLVGGGAKVSSPVGYVMPMARSGSVELSNVTNLRWPGKNPPPLAQKLDRSSSQGLTRRMYVACNIAAAVHEIHKLDCVFVDLKPQNILIAPDGAVSMVDLDSVQIRAGSRVFHGPLGSPEYMPSESYRMDFDAVPVIDPSWDRFSLAVIVYEILLGIHPFTATAKPTVMGCDTIEASIRFKMYVHGNNRMNLESIPPPHDGISALPKELSDLFKKTFDAVNPAQRPATHEWGETLKSAATGGAPALPKRIYAPKKPPGANASRTTAARKATSPVASIQSSQAIPCYGPPSGPCPGGSLQQVVSGVPNFNLHGRMHFLCNRCIGTHSAAAGGNSSQSTSSSGPPQGMQKCWGPGNSVCPHGSSRVPRYGYPNHSSRTGMSVYFCPDCLGEQLRLDAVARNNPSASNSSSSSSSSDDKAFKIICGIIIFILYVFAARSCR
jgi:serine/threonine protein kinase